MEGEGRKDRVGSLVALRSGKQAIVLGEHVYRDINESGLAIIPRLRVRCLGDGIELTIQATDVRWLSTVWN